ncbi:MAG: hypothetical protein GY850_45165 [bacterium]|nr:hypothetical protein [bacterium]
MPLSKSAIRAKNALLGRNCPRCKIPVSYDCDKAANQQYISLIDPESIGLFLKKKQENNSRNNLGYCTICGGFLSLSGGFMGCKCKKIIIGKINYETLVPPQNQE